MLNSVSACGLIPASYAMFKKRERTATMAYKAQNM